MTLIASRLSIGTVSTRLDQSGFAIAIHRIAQHGKLRTTIPPSKRWVFTSTGYSVSDSIAFRS